MERLTSAEFDTMYDRVKAEFDSMKASKEAELSEKYNDKITVTYAMYGVFAWKLFETMVALENTKMLLERAEKRYDDLLEREHGDGRSL